MRSENGAKVALNGGSGGEPWNARMRKGLRSSSALSSAPFKRPTPDSSKEGNCPRASDEFPSRQGAGIGRFAGRVLIVEVKDNGRGFRLDEVSAHGHGLASVRERLERIGGSAEWASAPNHGTTVSFRVPLKEASAPNGEEGS